MKRLILRSLWFVLIAYTVGVGLSWLYTDLFTEHKSSQLKINWTLVKQGDTMDYAAIGSSRVFHMIDMPLLNTLTGKKGINLGSSGSSYSDNYIVLSKYLARNKIGTLLLNVDELGFHSKSGYDYPFSDYEFMPYFFEDSINQVYKDNVSPWKYYLWTLVPISRYIEFNEHYELDSMIAVTTNKRICQLDTTAGTKLLYDIKAKEFSAADTLPVVTDTLTIERQDEIYFQKILALCRAKDVKVVLITTPLYGKGIYAPANRMKFQTYLHRLAGREKLPYINFYEAEGIQNNRYFRDVKHTNVDGTRLYTRYLATQLKRYL